MEPPEPPEPHRPETSLELAFPPAEHAVPDTSTGLELPPTPVPPQPVLPQPVLPQPVLPQAVPPEPAEPADASSVPTSGPLGDLVVAHFRRMEVAMLGRVLIETLTGALPPSMVQVERRRSLGRRLSGRGGEPVGVTVTAGDRTLTFRSPQVGVAEASIGHRVRGVVLSTTPVPVARWLEELADLLTRVTADDEATRVALERAMLG